MIIEQQHSHLFNTLTHSHLFNSSTHSHLLNSKTQLIEQQHSLTHTYSTAALTHSPNTPNTQSLLIKPPTNQTKKKGKEAHKRRADLQIQWSNLQNKGLISTDRNNKVTLQRTIPRSKFKSSARDSAPLACREIAMHGQGRRAILNSTRLPTHPSAVALSRRESTFSCSSRTHLSERSKSREKTPYRRLTSTDSDLEAFSRNPTGGSLAALAGRPTAHTKYPNQWFLSY